MNLEKINVGGNEYDISDPKAREMISEAYDQAKQYAAGNFCINNNKLYKCTSATTGVWDATKWKETNLAEISSELNGKMSDAINLIASDYIAITLNTDVAFDTDFQCFEKNRKVYLFTTIILKTAVSGSRTLGTIAEKYRPVAGYVVCSARSRQIPYTEQGTVWLHVGGSAILYGTFSAGSKVYIQTEYTI